MQLLRAPLGTSCARSRPRFDRENRKIGWVFDFTVFRKEARPVRTHNKVVYGPSLRAIYRPVNASNGYQTTKLDSRAVEANRSSKADSHYRTLPLTKPTAYAVALKLARVHRPPDNSINLPGSLNSLDDRESRNPQRAQDNRTNTALDRGHRRRPVVAACTMDIRAIELSITIRSFALTTLVIQRAQARASTGETHCPGGQCARAPGRFAFSAE